VIGGLILATLLTLFVVLQWRPAVAEDQESDRIRAAASLSEGEQCIAPRLVRRPTPWLDISDSNLDVPRENSSL